MNNPVKSQPVTPVQVFLRTAHNYDRDSVSLETGLHCADPSLAVQSERDEVDINTIVKRFGLTGQLPVGVRAPTYGDFDGISDFHEAANAIAESYEAFDQMPAEVRRRFDNDPGKFVDFCSDDSNREEAIKLGLIFDTVADASVTNAEALGASEPR